MELLHVSDTHLGYQAYSRLTPEGLNQREVDLQEAFRRVVDDALRAPPDAVVHSGDLFDVVRPNNRAIAFALHEVRRLSAAGIPFVVVSGNHEAPRLRETGSIFRIFEGLPLVHAVYRDGYEAVPVATRHGPVTFHCVPQTLRQSDFGTELERAAPEGPGRHVLVAHGTVAGVDGLFMNELNELSIPAGALRPEYDYIALGHFHNHRRLQENAAYAGSTERTSFSEAEEEKVYLRVRLGGGAPKVRAVPTQARPMRDAGVLEAGDLPAARLVESASQRVEAVTVPGAIVRLRVRGVDPSVLRGLDTAAIREAASAALHLDLRFEPAADEAAVQPFWELGALDAEFESFLAARPLRGLDRDRLRERALAFLVAGGGADDP